MHMRKENIRFLATTTVKVQNVEKYYGLFDLKI